MAERRTAAAADTFRRVYLADPSGAHLNRMDWANRNTGPAAHAKSPVNERFPLNTTHKHIKIFPIFIRVPKFKVFLGVPAPAGTETYKRTETKNLRAQSRQDSVPQPVSYTYSTFLLSAPGVVTITLSGVMTKAPLAVAAPLNIFSTTALKVSTTWPSVTYSAVPLI